MVGISFGVSIDIAAAGSEQDSHGSERRGHLRAGVEVSWLRRLLTRYNIMIGGEKGCYSRHFPRTVALIHHSLIIIRWKARLGL